MQNPADITGIRQAANQDSGICVNLLLLMRCPVPQRSVWGGWGCEGTGSPWRRAAVVGGAGLWGALCVLQGALCVLVWGGAGMWDWLSQGTGPQCLLGQGSCRCPFQLRAPRPAEDRSREISVTLGFSGPSAVGLSEGGMGKGVKRFPSSNWRQAQSRLKPFVGAV